jgi:hypothetical protein
MWEEQESKYAAQLRSYEGEKVLYNTFCEEKIAQIPAVKTQTTREAIQRIEQAKIDDFRAKHESGNHHKRYQIPSMPPKKLPPAKQQKLRQIAPFNSPLLSAPNNKENIVSNP